MRITDYERGHSLRDVCISLTVEEAEELSIYLKKLLRDPQINRAYLSEVNGARLEKEITIAVAGSVVPPKAFRAA